ncbi:hypothetical protein L1987_16369 [Smallanthus sonchifolius]|uniref:Uncharacterized protein n=1 Tax=Smallanthus sonchifolius TaxID=185202 RepID=A0ACB9J955_9ASTR|nr:hypothetical protein L1987_16369 [Smallanthus sonchifolius]
MYSDDEEQDDGDDNGDDGHDDNSEQVNVNAPIFEQETLLDSQDDPTANVHVPTPPQTNIMSLSPNPHTERHYTPPPQSNTSIPNWAVELKAQNETIKRVSSSSSSSYDAGRKGENEDKENDDFFDDAEHIENENEEINKELEDEYTRRNLIEMQIVAFVVEQTEKERNEKEMAEKQLHCWLLF